MNSSLDPGFVATNRALGPLRLYFSASLFLSVFISQRLYFSASVRDPTRLISIAAINELHDCTGMQPQR